jgi:predicted MPP superfamily phosphohydrolase
MVWLREILDKERGLIKWAAFILVVLLLQFVYVYAFFIEPNWLALERVRIVSPRLARALDGVKIIQLSDLEISGFGFKETTLIDKINKIKPDLILITGDLINEKQYMQALMDILSLTEPKFHTYLIQGNNDGCVGDFRNSKVWARANASFIDGKALRLNLKGKDDSYFWLIGASSWEEIASLTKDIPKNEPVVLMVHYPDLVKQAALTGIDLVLAGHTHGGQVNIPILRKFFPYAKRSNYIAGLYKVRDTLLYVNRGFTSDKSVRFLCPPEITLFDFRSQGRGRAPQVLRQDMPAVR